MKALVYHGPGQKSWEEVPDPTIQEPTDVICRIDATTICGTDLHILKGDVPAVTDGRILGHEAVGTITEVGDAVTEFKVGDRVIIPAITSCGKCSFCKVGNYSHCQTVGGIGWILGHLIDGTQAEYCRVPFAETSIYAVPDGLSDEDVLFLTDALPTGFEIGILNGNTKPGDTVAVVGAGPVGLSAVMTAGLAGAGRVITVDMDENRMDTAMAFGATHKVNAGDPDAIDKIKALSSDGLGVDVAVEAVGIPQTFKTCLDIVRPHGNVANVGVHGKSIDLPLQDLWISSITISMGLIDGYSIDKLMRMVESGKLPARKMATHHYTMDRFIEAYDLFANAAENKVVKLVITP
ncbi:zinc-dependent alcohol dehydrogenase family protein [Corynebacterium meridianum]|uniref:Zinc-dependent alcohol dehydrogenase family protein n=1 Tax=Corynebacterium meridianum TaxID=2765363 RepID=A0A934I430_9CORY|nr:zinc-dependent alcohol dehydrogenase family protein [Corynebacterium meridianum]MBI8988741.1 zinc-dependent alcohol dehydrogenase family protein [Corynebacterium meridianum]